MVFGGRQRRECCQTSLSTSCHLHPPSAAPQCPGIDVGGQFGQRKQLAFWPIFTCNVSDNAHQCFGTSAHPTRPPPLRQCHFPRQRLDLGFTALRHPSLPCHFPQVCHHTRTTDLVSVFAILSRNLWMMHCSRDGSGERLVSENAFRGNQLQKELSTCWPQGRTRTRESLSVCGFAWSCCFHKTIKRVTGACISETLDRLVPRRMIS